MSVPTTSRCSVSERILGKSFRAIQIENDLIAVTVLVDKGADIYQFIYKPRQLDVLWKTPWGINDRSRGTQTNFSSEAAWLETYPGGWQDIFPNGGDACFYKGVELNFHGEASTTAWDYAVKSMSDQAAEVELSTRLFRSPFRLTRTMRVEAGQPMLILRERITNEGGEVMDYMWGFHPAFGAPFLNEACHIDIGTRQFVADDMFDGEGNPLQPGEQYTWPLARRNDLAVDMSGVPPLGSPRAVMAYFHSFESGWYGITNRDMGLGVGLVWPTDVFPYAWLWQEMCSSPGYPFYKNTYTMAIEPFSSIPGRGLVSVMETTGSQRTLAAGESVEAELRAVFYQATQGIKRIEKDGTVVVAK